ncbi:MAG: hypothetical protein ACE5OZ_22570 [Candidatus Heimdallarchaeota archaeon]
MPDTTKTWSDHFDEELRSYKVEKILYKPICQICHVRHEFIEKKDDFYYLCPNCFHRISLMCHVCSSKAKLEGNEEGVTFYCRCGGASGSMGSGSGVLSKIEILTKQERRLWVSSVEEEHGFLPNQIFGAPIICKQFYPDARESYVQGLYLSSLVTIVATIEAFLAHKIPFEHIADYLSEKHKKVEPHKQLYLFKLIEIAKKNSLISEALYKELSPLTHVRNNLVHPRLSVNMLEFKLTEFRGTGSRSRAGGFESSSQKPVRPKSPVEWDENAIRTFLALVREFN